MFVRAENPLRYQAIVSGRPRSSSMAGCSSCERSRSCCSARSASRRASRNAVSSRSVSDACFAGNRQLDLDGRQRLTDLVVQLARDGPALLLLRVHQLGRQSLEVPGVRGVPDRLLGNSRLESAGVARRHDRDDQAGEQGQGAGLPDPPTHGVVDLPDLVVLLRERRPVERLDPPEIRMMSSRFGMTSSRIHRRASAARRAASHSRAGSTVSQKLATSARSCRTPSRSSSAADRHVGAERLIASSRRAASIRAR